MSGLETDGMGNIAALKVRDTATGQEERMEADAVVFAISIAGPHLWRLAGRVPANSTCIRGQSTVCVLQIPPFTAWLDLSMQAQRAALCAPLLTLPHPRLVPHRHAAAGAGHPRTGGAA